MSREFQYTTVHDLVSKSKMVIPRFQRPYQWKEEQVNDFIDDITHLIGDDHKDDHYYGTIVLGDCGEVEWSRSNNVRKYEIIDGQQRITTAIMFMSSLADELRAVSEHVSDPDISTEADDTARSIRQAYVGRHSPSGVSYRLHLESDTQPFFETAVSEDGTPSKERARHLASRRIVDANSVIQSRLLEWRLKYTDESTLDDADDSALVEYAEYLFTVASLVNNDFFVGKFVERSLDDAARRFKIINKRGKDLSEFDQVKSHLVYCSSQSESPTEDVSHRLKQAAQRVTSAEKTDESTLDQYVRVHWTIWTGEYPARMRNKDASVSNQIETKSRYADPKRDDINHWVREYAETFYQLSTHFAELHSPEAFRDAYPTDEWQTHYVAERLNSLKASNINWMEYLTALVSAKKAFGHKSEEFLTLITALESLSFRYHHIIKGSKSIESDIGKGAYQIFWGDISADAVSQIFNGDPAVKIVSDSRGEALSRLTDRVVELLKECADDDSVREYLTEDDVLDGQFTRGWGGFRAPLATTKILFREYEKHLRSQAGSTKDLSSINPCKSWDDNHSLEFILTRRSDSLPDQHIRQKLGNIALVENRLAPRAKYNSFPNTESLYEESDLIHLNRLANNNEDWKPADIQRRTDELIEFILTRWSAEPTIESPYMPSADTAGSSDE